MSRRSWPHDPTDPIAPVTVLYDDHECTVINKPSGLLTQAPPGIPSVESQARRFWQPEATPSPPLALAHPPIESRQSTGPAPAPLEAYVGVPHRLDRATSGALLLGQSKAVTGKLAAQFEKRTVRKTYWALLEGCVVPADGSWVDWMRKLPERALSEITAADDPAAQNAELTFQVLVQTPQVSLVEIELKTGRTHQIRLQSSSRGWPILGDSAYGAQRPFGAWPADERLRAIALHARKIDFWHPKLHRPIVVTAPVTQDWINFALEFAPSLLPLLQKDDVV